MLKVNNTKTMYQVTGRFMKASRRRNWIIVTAVIMTCVMFTALLTASLSMIATGQQMEMRALSDSAHVRVSNLTRQQFEAVSGWEEAERTGMLIYGAPAENTALGNFRADLMYADAAGAESRMAAPTTGRLPKSEGEAAVNTLILDLLGVPYELGSRVELTYTAGGKTKTGAFTLCGYWKGDQMAQSHPVWVSKAFFTENFAEATADSLQKGSAEGAFEAVLWFAFPGNLSEKVEALDAAYHISGTSGAISSNPAYDIYGSDGFAFDAAAVILLIIFAAGNLIIYNVFNLSVKNDMRTYGLLRNIGITGKQLKKIVRLQALYLSAAGIPAGLVLGYFAGKAMSPYLAGDMQFSQVSVITPLHPGIFIASALLTLITVYMGCAKPARMVSKLSPAAALRESEEAGGLKTKAAKWTAGAAGCGAGKKTGRGFSALSMAWSNLGRNRKKAVVVILSLTLPLILLNSIYSIAKGFHPDYFADAYMDMDFKISGCTSHAKTSSLQAVTPETAQAAGGRNEVEKTAVVYNTEAVHKLGEVERARLKKVLQAAEDSDYLGDYQMEKEWKILKDSQVQAHVMGLNKGAFSEIDFASGKCSYEDFASGDYVITGLQPDGFGDYYKTGDRVELSLGEGKSRVFTVIAAGELNYELEYPFGVGTYFDYTFLLPEQAYFDLGAEDRGAMVMGISVKDGEEKAFDRWLSGYIEESGKNLYVDSKIGLMEMAEQFAAKYYLVLGLLCAILFVIGVMNFFNTAAVSLMARKKELALLEAVGMTRRQIMKMLIAESLTYLFGALILADTLGSLLSLLVIKKTVGKAFFFTAQTSITMSLLALPLLLAIAAAVPYYNFRKMGRQSVVQRLRVE